MKKTKSQATSNLSKNQLLLTFSGLVTSQEMSKVYTDVRFCVQDLAPGFSVITDFSSCRLMYLNALIVFRKIYNYILTSNSGEMVRVVHPKRIITKQVLNFALRRSGYKPVYAKDLEEAEKVIGSSSKRDGLRFELHEMPATFNVGNDRFEGFILNLSTSGCAISSKTAQISLGESIQVQFAFLNQKEKKTFDLRARVVRVESYTFASQFVQIDSKEKSLLWACLIKESE